MPFLFCLQVIVSSFAGPVRHGYLLTCKLVRAVGQEVNHAVSDDDVALVEFVKLRIVKLLWIITGLSTFAIDTRMKRRRGHAPIPIPHWLFSWRHSVVDGMGFLTARTIIAQAKAASVYPDFYSGYMLRNLVHDVS